VAEYVYKNLHYIQCRAECYSYFNTLFLYSILKIRHAQVIILNVLILQDDITNETLKCISECNHLVGGAQI
jgi:hypothetical protein